MVDADGNEIVKGINYIKLVASVVALIVAVSGFWYGLTEHFATAKDLQNLQQQTITTFDQLQKDFDTRSKDAALRRQYDFLTERLYRLKDTRRKYPADEEVQEDYLDTKTKLEALDKLLNQK